MQLMKNILIAHIYILRNSSYAGDSDELSQVYTVYMMR